MNREDRLARIESELDGHGLAAAAPSRDDALWLIAELRQAWEREGANTRAHHRRRDNWRKA